jgi:hypothetical protein
MPTLVALKVALVVFTPVNTVPERLKMAGYFKGHLIGAVDMNHPSLFPRSDYSDVYGREDVIFTRRAWSVTFPQSWWMWLKPGLSLAFSDQSGTSGTLNARSIQFEGPAELVLHSIRMGILTGAPINDREHFMLVDPERSGADYFNTIPVSKLIMASYETVNLTRVILADGTIYTDYSRFPNPDVYSGDLRENVGKAQMATGINLANFGVSFSLMTQSNPHVFNRRVLHHIQGRYASGDVVHGLSGGNGMCTLWSSRGNELSHELGHSYGLGHYPGADFSLPHTDDKIRKAVHHSESGWGYIPFRNRMRTNIRWNALYSPNSPMDVNGANFTESFRDTFYYNTDAMSGGDPFSEFSEYTHHTGFSALQIQRHLTSSRYDGFQKVWIPRPIPDTTFPSGYKSWNVTSGECVDAKRMDPGFSYLAPTKIGVPVFTVLGGYNPNNQSQVVIYPPFRSNYGNTFDNLPTPNVTATQRQCWLEVKFTSSPTQRVLLTTSNGVFQVNINIEEAKSPQQAQLFCGIIPDNNITLYQSVSFPENCEPMPAPAVFGQENGFNDLKRVELKELEEALLKESKAERPVVSGRMLEILRAWGSADLTPDAKSLADALLENEAQARMVEDVLEENGDKLFLETSDERRELDTILTQLELLKNGSLFDSGHCITLSTAQNGLVLSETVPSSPRVSSRIISNCNDSAAKWFMDSAGAIRNAKRPHLCLHLRNSYGAPIEMANCSYTLASQQWHQTDQGVLTSYANPDFCMDFAWALGVPLTWSVHGGGNQRWVPIALYTNPYLPLLGAEYVEMLSRIYRAK